MVTLVTEKNLDQGKQKKCTTWVSKTPQNDRLTMN